MVKRSYRSEQIIDKLGGAGHKAHRNTEIEEKVRKPKTRRHKSPHQSLPDRLTTSKTSLNLSLEDAMGNFQVDSRLGMICQSIQLES